MAKQSYVEQIARRMMYRTARTFGYKSRLAAIQTGRRHMHVLPRYERVVGAGGAGGGRGKKSVLYLPKAMGRETEPARYLTNALIGRPHDIGKGTKVGGRVPKVRFRR